MGKIKNLLGNYQSIPRALIFDKVLSDRARFVYVYMASKPDDWEFLLKPMAEELKYSVETLRKYINELVERGWISKGEQAIGECGKRFGAVEYVIHASLEEGENFRHGKIPPRENTESEESPLLKEREEERKEKKKEKDFDFRARLIQDGVDEKVADDWMKVRKKKGASNTETAYNGLIRESRLARISIAEAVRCSCENSWCGFKAEWYANRGYSQCSTSTVLTPPLPKGKEKVTILLDGTTYNETKGIRFYKSERFGKLVSLPLEADPRPSGRHEWLDKNGWVEMTY